jgi:hypothetical protein
MVFLVEEELKRIYLTRLISNINNSGILLPDLF